MSESPDPRYPIGQFTPPDPITPADIRDAILTLAEMPEQLRESIRHLHQSQIDTPYREGGWTIRQLIHHIADSHSTAFHRLRKALTEDWPEITGYDEAAFAELPDRTAPPEWSLEAIEGLHARWVMLLQSMDASQFQRGYNHAERGRTKLDYATLNYAWHARHHVAHITTLRCQKGW